jgi:hypothetical protein
MSDNNSKSNGLSIGTVLFLIFLTLKLADVGAVANWSWWWVCSPIWIPIVGLIVVAFIAWLFS